MNPGAFEYLGNGVDDDCDPTTKDKVLVPDCSPGPLIVPTESDHMIRAMDLCQFTTENAPKKQKKWGVISSQVLLADGTLHPNIDSINNVQLGVLANYGPNVAPEKGLTMAALSSGTARKPGDLGYVHPQNGPVAGQLGTYNANTQVSVPPGYLSSHNGSIPSPANCPTCTGPDCKTAFDSVNLKAKIRVPTNAFSFSYRFKFYTAEYPEFVCQKFNDFFLVLLNSNAMGLPADHNIAFDAQKSPVSVNNGFFEVCFAFKPGDCPGGTLQLEGTGMGGWDGGYKDGGGTEWLTNEAPVTPGETIDLEFIIWDAGDHNVDSLVLLDNFRWSITPSPVGTHK